MDDCLTSVATEQKGIALMHELREVYASGGFNLTKWIFNSRTVLASISEQSKAKTVKDLDLEKDKLPLERALWGSVVCRDLYFAVQSNPTGKASYKERYLVHGQLHL